MNKKGFMDAFFWTPLIIIVYVYCWIFIFGPIMAQFGAELVTSQGLVGTEALLWKTLNIWGGLIPLLIFIAWKGLGGGGQ